MVELAIVCYASKCYKAITGEENNDNDDEEEEETPQVSAPSPVLKNGGHACNRVAATNASPLMTQDENNIWLRSINSQTKIDQCVPQIVQMLSKQEQSESEENKTITRKPKIISHFKFSPESIDRVSMLLFPMSFTIFNATYWWYYVGNSQAPEDLTLHM